jgi:MoaA/NifB/PqqE/SkfB family radical SAM enzyme
MKHHEEHVDAQAKHEMSPLSGFRQFAVGALRGRPRTVFLEVTLRCNAKCRFCPYWQEPRALELDDFCPVVKHFSPVSVTLTGGEPLLRADVCDIVGNIKSSGNYFVSLITNGIKLDHAYASRLRAAGLDGLSVSLNFPDARQDEEKQVPGLYRHIAEVLPRLSGVGFRRLSLNTVLMATNLQWIPALIAQAREWQTGLTVSCYSPNKTGWHPLVIPPAQTGELLETLELLKREARDGCVENSRWYLERIEEFHRHATIPGCTAGRRTIHVTPQGLVRPCPELPIVSHWSTYDCAKSAPPLCGACWYACRGEVQAPLTLGRIKALARYVARGPRRRSPARDAAAD